MAAGSSLSRPDVRSTTAGRSSRPGAGCRAPSRPLRDLAQPDRLQFEGGVFAIAEPEAHLSVLDHAVGQRSAANPREHVGLPLLLAEAILLRPRALALLDHERLYAVENAQEMRQRRLVARSTETHGRNAVPESVFTPNSGSLGARFDVDPHVPRRLPRERLHGRGGENRLSGRRASVLHLETAVELLEPVRCGGLPGAAHNNQSL